MCPILLYIFLQIHLFDIDVKGGQRFKESDVLSGGNEFTTFLIDNFKIGIGICYDIRFEEMARIYRNKGKKIYEFYIIISLIHFNIMSCIYNLLFTVQLM